MNNQPNYDYENTNYHPQGFAPPKLPKDQDFVSQKQSQIYPAKLTQEQLPREFKPLGAWAYFGYSLLFGIPVIGLIFAIVFACGGAANINLRNYARSFFCSILVAFILMVVLIVIVFVLSAISGVALTDYFISM